ncbi:mitochondrial import inner membrane translocase subunit TIM44-2-like isoform X2 [Malania oleifera]|uniref:mitochondrial import inner membrane translocase subunit TIM44-2-like isoform X2 n=1 Tax=Malania oleifera TaxID=397392 RepID=UPI0025AE92BF|nr:mitochondrial import inner membrane translocase subunit TIM44-2-like isoform X2 [Malania oleifera]
MASRKLVRDFLLAKQPLFSQLLTSQQASTARFRLISNHRQFSVFNEFSKQVKGEAESNPEFQQSVKELKEKAGELKEVKEDLKVRTKQTTEQLYKRVDGVWTEAEATAKKVKETLGVGKQESSGSTASGKFEADGNDSRKETSREEKQQQSREEKQQQSQEEKQQQSQEEKQQQSAPSDSAETLFGKFKSAVASVSPKVSMTFQKIKEAKAVDLAKKGMDIVKDELSGNPSKRKRMKHAASSSSTGERSTRTDVVIVPSKQSRWSKKWEAFKEKMQGHPLYKHISGLSEPVVTKSQELAEDMRERWETSDNPVVHKIQDINESVFGETHAALSFKEIRRRDPSFSLPEFVAEVQEVVKPVLNAYIKGDIETLNKYCCPEVIERCKLEHRASKSQGVFFDNKILHVSEVEVRETKMMGSTPIIILAFQTQQVYCIRDKNGSVREGGKDTIHTVYYAWAMQQMDEDGGAAIPVWRLREMQQLGIQALI